MSRLFWGTQVILFLAPTSVALGILTGAPLGLISGYVGGRLDAVIMRGVDILLSFPTLLIYILIITSIGSSAVIVVIAISLGSVPPITRIVRSLTLDERTKDYLITTQAKRNLSSGSDKCVKRYSNSERYRGRCAGS